jgi:DNA-binding Xre family transcriptional regulator
MRWNLRAAAVRRGIESAAELRRRLASAGLVVSVGKMSGLWAHTPLTIRLEDLEVLCAVLSCQPSDLLIPQPPPAPVPAPVSVASGAGAGHRAAGSAPAVVADSAPAPAGASTAATAPVPASGRTVDPAASAVPVGRAGRRVIVRSVPPA